MKIILAVVFLCGGLFIASAIPIEIPGAGQDMAKNGTGIAGGNANDDANNFFRLETVLGSLTGYATPTLTGAEDLGSNIVPTGDLVGFTYAVLHYGAGNGGTQGSGGGVEIFYLNGATDFTFDANGTGPNGFGGFSSLTLFKANGVPSVPDGGSTVAMLGAALSGLGLLVNRFKK